MTIEKNEKNHPAVNDEQSRASLPASGSHLSTRWQAVLVGLFWLLSLAFVYITIFVSSLGLLLFAAAVLLREFCLKKNQIPVLPRTFTAWIHRTLLYDVFVRRVHGKRNLRACRGFGGWFFTIGLILLIAVLTHPVLDLEDMVVERGRYSHFVKLGRKDPCGNALLTFHRIDGTPFQFWGYAAEADALQKNKNEIYALWGEPNIYHLFPECRKYPSLRQVQGDGYQLKYRKDFSIKAKHDFTMAGMFFMICSGLCLLRIVIAAIREPHERNN